MVTGRGCSFHRRGFIKQESYHGASIKEDPSPELYRVQMTPNLGTDRAHGSQAPISNL